MSSSRELLALRKEVLVARAALQRVTIGREVDALRESLRLPRAARAIIASPQGRSALLGLLLLVAGRVRIARLVGIAVVTVAIVKLVGALAGVARAPVSTSTDLKMP